MEECKEKDRKTGDDWNEGMKRSEKKNKKNGY
jgi:hypothetical protein